MKTHIVAMAYQRDASGYFSPDPGVRVYHAEVNGRAACNRSVTLNMIDGGLAVQRASPWCQRRACAERLHALDTMPHKECK